MDKYPELGLPTFEFQVKTENGIDSIWDIIRKKWIILTPEEWVRQHVIHYFTEHLSYPMGLITVESQIMVGKIKKRFDIVVMDRTLKPWLICECKSPSVSINNETLRQAGNYNSQLKCPYLAVTNGIQHGCFQIDFINGRFQSLNHFPDYKA